MMNLSVVEFLLARIAEDESGFAVGNYIPTLRARLLTECKVKHAIVDWAAPDLDLGGRYVSDDGFELLCLLATAYGDHPDCRPEWLRKVAFP